MIVKGRTFDVCRLADLRDADLVYGFVLSVFPPGVTDAFRYLLTVEGAMPAAAESSTALQETLFIYMARHSEKVIGIPPFIIALEKTIRRNCTIVNDYRCNSVTTMAAPW